jgi:hypothetical protein
MIVDDGFDVTRDRVLYVYYCVVRDFSRIGGLSHRTVMAKVIDDFEGFKATPRTILFQNVVLYALLGGWHNDMLQGRANKIQAILETEPMEKITVGLSRSEASELINDMKIMNLLPTPRLGSPEV